MPVYWKPKYGTRSSRHRAWARGELRREAAAKSPRTSRGAWFGRLFRRSSRGHS